MIERGRIVVSGPTVGMHHDSMLQRLETLVEHAKEGRGHSFAAYRTRYVQHDHVAGAFPDDVDNRVAQQTWVYPVFDIAIAAAHLQGFQRHVFTAFWDVVFTERGHDAQQAAIFFHAMPVYAFKYRRRLECQGRAAFDLHQQVNQLTAHEGVIRQRTPEGDAPACMHYSF